MTEIHLNVCHCLGYTQNMRRSLSTMLGVGYQICGGVCQQRLVLVIKSVAEFANNSWCWLSNLLWRSFPTTLGVGYQICGGVCQQRLVLVIKSVAELVNNAWCWLSNLHRFIVKHILFIVQTASVV